MLNAKDLREYMTVYFEDLGDGEITFELLQNMIEEEAEKYDIEVAFEKSEVKSGGMLNKNVEDCLILYHPLHKKDYYEFCIRIQKQGKRTYLIIEDFGQSKQINKIETAKFMKEDRRGKQMSYQVGSIVGSALRTMGKNKLKLEEEQRYYECLQQVFNEITS